MPRLRFPLSTGICLLIPLLGCHRPQSGGGQVLHSGVQHWEMRNPRDLEFPVGNIVRGESSYVSFNGMEMRVSLDGRSWRHADFPIAETWTWTGGYGMGSICGINDVAYGKDRFIALSCGEIRSSFDGAAWARVGAADRSLIALAFGNDRFVAVGDSGRVMISPDGETWTASPQDSGLFFGSIAFGNGVFVATHGGYEGVWHSRDGEAWERTEFPGDTGSPARNQVLFGNGRFFFVGRGNYQSSDGKQWTRMETGISYPAFFANDRFIAFQDLDSTGTRRVSWSSDLADWTTVATRLGYRMEWLDFHRGKYLTSSGNDLHAKVSEDLVSWSEPDMVTRMNLDKVVFGNDRFVAVGYNGVILTSPDGADWNQEDSPTTEPLSALAFGNRVFVAGGTNGALLSSRDGKSWTLANPGIDGHFTGCAYGNGIFLCTNSSTSDLFLSEDGLHWRRQTIEGTGSRESYSIVFGKGVFLVFNGNGGFASSDGVHWSPSYIGSRSLFRARFDGRRFVLEQFCGDAVGDCQSTSEDGYYWRLGRSGHGREDWALPMGEGEAYVSGSRLFWEAGDSVREILFPNRLRASVAYGNGVFVGVGGEGAIGTLRAEKDPTGRFRAGLPEEPPRLGPFQERQFVGAMDNRLAFLLRISSDGAALSGSYAYLGRKQSLQVRGAIDTVGRFHLEEISPAGAVTGTWNGRIAGSEIIGEWAHPKASDYDPPPEPKLLLHASEMSPARVEERLQAYRQENGRLVGVHYVKEFTSLVLPDSLEACGRTGTGWACWNGTWGRGYPLEPPWKPQYPFSLVESLRLEVKPDFTLELYLRGERKAVLPQRDNGKVYLQGLAYMLKGIRMKELEIGEGENILFTLDRSPDGNSFVLTGSSTHGAGGYPAFTFAKEP